LTVAGALVPFVGCRKAARKLSTDERKSLREK
jgi:hypothetical protein